MAKIHTKNGFEYYGENSMREWSWYFRPCGRTPFMYLQPIREQGYRKVKKTDMEAFLCNVEQARAYYETKLGHLSNVAQAEAKFERAKARYEETQQPDWEDDFRGNNPGKIGRKTREIEVAFKSAERALEYAKKLQEEKRIDALPNL